MLAKVSEVADIDLIPVMDTEISAVNVSTGDPNDEGVHINAPSKDDDPLAFAWHYDSYPFVCITMLSDCTGMVGGETASKTG